MNHRVPDFHEIECDDSILTSSSTVSRPKKPSTGEEEIMELLWQNGQVVMQSQNQRPSSRKSASGGEVAIPTEREVRSTAEEQQQHLFMQEDEMASWLQYPLDDSSFERDFYSDLLYSATPPPPLVTSSTQPRAAAEIRPQPAAPRPPIPPPLVRPDNPPRVHNFVHFSRLPVRPRTEAAAPSVRTEKESSTVVESCETPAVGPESRVSHTVADSTATAGGTSAAAGELAAGTCDLTFTSSPGGSRTSFSEETRRPHQKPSAAADDRKRKAREADDNECQSEDTEFEAKKEGRSSASTKRSRAAEVHNLSERRRRDRINEKMKALQELIPRCNKSDKASMLDEAIEYLKSLQLQVQEFVQMMSMGCGMVPMMYPGMQQYMPAMGMMGMGMEMGMSRPIVPYPSMMPNPAASHRFPLPQFHMQPLPVQQQQPTDHPLPNSTIPQNQAHPRFPNFVDPYQQYLGFHPSQLPIPQNQAVMQHDAHKPSTSKEIGNPDNHQTVNFREEIVYEREANIPPG